MKISQTKKSNGNLTEIGALWEHQNPDKNKGELFLSVRIKDGLKVELGSEDVILGFSVESDNPKAPKFRLYVKQS